MMFPNITQLIHSESDKMCCNMLCICKLLHTSMCLKHMHALLKKLKHFLEFVIQVNEVFCYILKTPS